MRNADFWIEGTLVAAALKRSNGVCVDLCSIVGRCVAFVDIVLSVMTYSCPFTLLEEEGHTVCPVILELPVHVPKQYRICTHDHDQYEQGTREF